MVESAVERLLACSIYAAHAAHAFLSDGPFSVCHGIRNTARETPRTVDFGGWGSGFRLVLALCSLRVADSIDGRLQRPTALQESKACRRA